jgi:hypothetical protein
MEQVGAMTETETTESQWSASGGGRRVPCANQRSATVVRSGSSSRQSNPRILVTELLESPTRFEGQVLVGSRIVDSLSSGLYHNPASCLKELVNNSYDADAKNVHILVKPDADVMIVEDDGTGMDQATFIRHFSKVSESHKRDDDDITGDGRPKIGKIGIGFIAANELCQKMEIFSTMRGSREVLHVFLDFQEMRLDPEDRKNEDGDISKGDYEGEILDGEEDTHGTQIFLHEIRSDARQALIGAKSRVRDTNASLYGLKESTVEQRLDNLDAWSSLDEYSRIALGVALNVPVAYFDNWCPPEHGKELRVFTKKAQSLNFNVTYDGTSLRKPVVLHAGSAGDKTMVKVLKFKGKNVNATGYLFAQHGVLRPEELNGVLIRIRNAAVGEYRNDYLGFPHAEATLFQRWVSGEIWADDGLEPALNIDRRTLRETHPAYVELRDWFHDELGTFLGDVRREMYAVESRKRADNKAEQQLAKLESLADTIGNTYGPTAASQVRDAWLLPSESPQGPPVTGEHDEQPELSDREVRALLKAANKKYTVAQVYELVVEAAQESLSAQEAERFLAELTRRIRG